MGVTAFDIELLEKAISFSKNIESVCELGSQNLYISNEEKPPFASIWYEKKNIRYACIDLAGDNNSIRLDLANPIEVERQFDLVTDFGTSEHVVQMEGFESISFHEGHINSIYPKGNIKSIEEGYYNCWKNKHNLLNIGGLMINVNPKTGHWPGHGYTYLTDDFYLGLCKIAGYQIQEVGQNCAMGNCETGINIYSILKKTSELFPSFEEFKKLPLFRI